MVMLCIRNPLEAPEKFAQVGSGQSVGFFTGDYPQCGETDTGRDRHGAGAQGHTGATGAHAHTLPGMNGCFSFPFNETN